MWMQSNLLHLYDLSVSKIGAPPFFIQKTIRPIYTRDCLFKAAGKSMCAPVANIISDYASESESEAGVARFKLHP